MKFFHWNLNSLCARDGVKKQLIEVYDAVHKYDVIAVSSQCLIAPLRMVIFLLKGLAKTSIEVTILAIQKLEEFVYTTGMNCQSSVGQDRP